MLYKHLTFFCSHFAFIQFHVDKKGRVNYAQTDMLIHVVNNQTNTILDVERYTFYFEIHFSLQSFRTTLLFAEYMRIKACLSFH